MRMIWKNKEVNELKQANWELREIIDKLKYELIDARMYLNLEKLKDKLKIYGYYTIFPVQVDNCGNCFIIVQSDGRLMIYNSNLTLDVRGYINFTTKNKTVFIDDIIVLDRRIGYGSALIKRLEEIAINEGKLFITGKTSIVDDETIRNPFFIKNGFEILKNGKLIKHLDNEKK